jgi:hypothetical protein
LRVSESRLGKKIKLEKAIREILVADTDSESGAEASDIEEYFEEEEEQQQQEQASAEVEPQAAKITNLVTASRKEHKFSSLCRSSKRCE